MMKGNSSICQPELKIDLPVYYTLHTGGVESKSFLICVDAIMNLQ